MGKQCGTVNVIRVCTVCNLVCIFFWGGGRVQFVLISGRVWNIFGVKNLK